MALLKQCFCYSLRQGSFIIGSYSLVVYCVAFAVELWWIVESLLILPAPAYTLCALYFFDFIMAAILLFGLLVRQRKYLMSWTLMTVLSFFPEAGMVLFMSLYYWPAHKFEYGVIELVYWSLRAIFNIFGAVCVCSLYLTWRDEELILGRLHDLTLANVETGSGVGCGVLRNGNFTGTLKGNNNLAYQNYAYVDSSPGLPENINYKNPNNFHSKGRSLVGSLHRRTFFIRYRRHQQNARKICYYYYYRHKTQLCAKCETVTNHYFNRKVISSLPTLFTSDLSPNVSGVTCYCTKKRVDNEHFPLFKCNCRITDACGKGGGGGVACSEASISNIISDHEVVCVPNYSLYTKPEKLPSSHPLRITVESEETIVKVTSSGTQQTDSAQLREVAAKEFNKLDLSKSETDGLRADHIVPKIEIVICTEVEGSIETTVIRQSCKRRTISKKGQSRKSLRRSHFIPLSYFRRAVSDSANIVVMEEQDSGSEPLSSFNSMKADIGSTNSLTSIIIDCPTRAKFSKKSSKGGRGERKLSSPKTGKHGEGGRAWKIFAYLSHVVRCCISRSTTSLLSFSVSQSEDGEVDNSSMGGSGGISSLGSPRGLFNTRSLTMHSDVPATPHRAHLPMKSEFNPAMLFDPAYRKSRISELGIAGIGLEPPGQIPIGTFNRMNRSRSLWNVSNEDYWNRPPPSRPVSMGYVNHIHQLDQLKDCCFPNNNSTTTMNLNKQMIMKGFGGCSHSYRNPIHGSTTSVATSNHHLSMTPNGYEGGILYPECRRNWLATNGRRAQSVDGLNHFYHRYYGRNIAAHHLHPGGLISADLHSQDWSKSSICQDDHDDLRNYQDIAL